MSNRPIIHKFVRNPLEKDPGSTDETAKGPRLVVVGGAPSLPGIARRFLMSDDSIAAPPCCSNPLFENAPLSAAIAVAVDGVGHDFGGDVAEFAVLALRAGFEGGDGVVRAAAAAGDEDAAGLVDDAARLQGLVELRHQGDGAVVDLGAGQGGGGLTGEALCKAFAVGAEGFEVVAVDVQRADRLFCTTSGIDRELLMSNRSASSAKRKASITGEVLDTDRRAGTSRCRHGLHQSSIARRRAATSCHSSPPP